LAEQREKLERAEKGLDDIHYTTQLTQRTLNSIKSVFGGYFKNKFTRAPTKAVPTEKNVCSIHYLSYLIISSIFFSVEGGNDSIQIGKPSKRVGKQS
jgi:hypothetical protein